MRPTALATGLAGIAVVGLLLVMGASSIDKNPVPISTGIFADVPASNEAPPASTKASAVDIAQATAPAPTAVPATPDAKPAGDTPAAASPAPPASTPSPEPAKQSDAQTPTSTPPGQSPPNDAKTVALKSVDLGRIQAESAGVLAIGDKRLQLTGIVPTDPNRICKGENGKEWPCGTMARTALRNFLRARAINCDLPSSDWQGTVVATCRYVKTDLGDWLVRSGWAEAEAGSALVSAGDEARKNKLGIFGDDPRKDRPSTLAPPPVKEDPLNPI